MSESIEIMKRVYDAWNRGDFDAGLPLVHPDVELRTSGNFPGIPLVYRGRDGIRQFYDDFVGIWESLEVNVERYEDVGDRTLALWHFVGHGRDGITVEAEAGHIARVEDGLVTEMITYGSWADALAAAGLSA